jgi:hypothetical protein
MAKGDVTKKVISKSTKDRRPTSYQLDHSKNMIRTRSGYAIAFKQVVELTEMGKNKKGKTIYLSETKHERIS